MPERFLLQKERYINTLNFTCTVVHCTALLHYTTLHRTALSLIHLIAVIRNTVKKAKVIWLNLCIINAFTRWQHSTSQYHSP